MEKSKGGTNVKITEQLYRFQNSTSIDETASETGINHGKKLYNNGLSFNPKYCILTEPRACDSLVKMH
jgi:hypothetical protein